MQRNKVPEALSVGTEYWKGIITKINGEIDYSKTAVGILSQIFQDMVFYLDNDGESDREFAFKERGKLITRHVRLIGKLEFEGEKTEEEISELAERVVSSKELEVKRLLDSASSCGIGDY